ncbi:MAG: cytochrome P460 family protein, partial [Alkalispirochaetaceae bacterium]
MRAIPLLLLPAAFAVLILGCAGDGEQEPLVTGNHENWSRTTTETLDFPVPGHGGGARRIFINPTGETVEPPDSAQEPWDYPDGTIIVKEIYSSSDPPEDVPPDSLTIMVKDRDHPMSRGGWVWITKSPGSDRETIFTEQFCVTCHANANEEHPYGDNNREGQFRDYT